MLLCHCSICQQSFTEKCTISALLCGHVFHSDCLSSWLNNKSNCPQCRTSNVGNYIKKLYFDKMPDFNNSFTNTNESVIEENFKLHLELDKMKELQLKMINQLKLKSKSNEQLKKEFSELQSSQIKEYLSFTAQIFELNQTNDVYKQKLDKLKFMNDIFTKSQSEINSLIENLPKDEFQIEKLCSALIACRNDLKYHKKEHEEALSKLSKAELLNVTIETELREIKEKMNERDCNDSQLNVSGLLDTPVTAMRARMHTNDSSLLLLDSPIEVLAANGQNFRAKSLANPFRCSLQKRKTNQKNSAWNLDIMTNNRSNKPLRAPMQYIIKMDSSDTENQSVDEQPVKKLKKIPRSRHIQPFKRS